MAIVEIHTTVSYRSLMNRSRAVLQDRCRSYHQAVKRDLPENFGDLTRDQLAMLILKIAQELPE